MNLLPCKWICFVCSYWFESKFGENCCFLSPRTSAVFGAILNALVVAVTVAVAIFGPNLVVLHRALQDADTSNDGDALSFLPASYSTMYPLRSYDANNIISQARCAHYATVGHASLEMILLIILCLGINKDHKGCILAWLSAVLVLYIVKVIAVILLLCMVQWSMNGLLLIVLALSIWAYMGHLVTMYYKHLRMRGRDVTHPYKPKV